jgi:hypothetical protein
MVSLPQSSYDDDVCLHHACAAAGSADEPKAQVGTLLKLGALFAGWYLANIYFNM